MISHGWFCEASQTDIDSGLETHQAAVPSDIFELAEVPSLVRILMKMKNPQKLHLRSTHHQQALS